MLQTNCNSSNNSNSMDSQGDIVKRLEKLNKWQEEQKRMLNDRQNMQRQMLGLEQRNMYQMLGLLHPSDDDAVVDEVADAAGNMLNSGDVNFGIKKDKKHKLCTDNEFKGIFSFETLEGVTKLSAQASGKQVITKNEVGLKPNMAPKLKQPFLRRGEGLKQRFKISPDALRLHNLPRYKYATTHPKIRNLQRQRFAPKAKPSQEDARLQGGSEVKAKPKNTAALQSRSSTPMGMQEKKFQQVLMNSKHMCNSTPDEKNEKPTIAVMLPKVRFGGDKNDGRGQTSPCTEDSEEGALPSMPWAKVLDSQQLRAINVQEIRAAGKHSDRSRNKEAERSHSMDEGDENLTIFELLERKACEGNIDMNSSCIKRFLERKRHRRQSEADESDAICVNECVTPVGLNPKVDVALRPDSSDEEHSSPVHNIISKSCESTKNSMDLNETKRSNDSAAVTANKTSHVRFAEKTGMHEYCTSHDLLDSSSSFVEDASDYNKRSSDLFHQFKDALFNALLGKGADGDNSNNEMRLSLQSPPSALTQELHEKSNLIRARLDELEKEIAAFKENNQQLLRAKQAHDLEREHFTQERIELMDRLKDDRIQMEIYLHDERMKIEEEKRNFQQYMSTQRLAASSKDRKEIARLKQELETMQVQQKQREQVHASAQARLRVQIRNMERDQQQLRDEIERLTKENKKLQSDKSKLERDSNTRMLYEINRNIAKLTPKLATPTLTTTEPVRTIYNGTKKMNSKLSPPSGKTKSSKLQRKFSAPPPSRCLSNIDVRSSTNEAASIETPDPYMANISSCDYDCNNNEDGHGDALETDDDSLDNELEAKQTQILNKSQPTQVATNTEKEKVELNEKSANSTKDTNENFRREIVNADGSRDILYPNGNLKKISADGMNIRMLYFNKDVKETNVNEGTVRYYYAETNTWHTTYLDGLEILEFPNGQTEHRHKNGMVEVHFPDSSIKVTNPAEKNKLEEWRFADGTNLIQMRNGDKILLLPNGQKEIHTKLHKRREYPDGTVKLVYPDGSQETRYSNGRVRLKDKDGLLVMDTESA